MKKIVVYGMSVFVMLFLSCAAPFYYERAEIKKGFYCGAGVGVRTGDAISGGGGEGLDYYPEVDYCIAGLTSLYFQHGFSERIALFL